MMTDTYIRGKALEIGFDDCGVAVATRLDEDARFMEQWLSHGYEGNMTYLQRHREERYDIRKLVPGAQTVVVCLLHYNKSGRDYHRTVKSLLYRLQESLVAENGEKIVSLTHQHIFCDSAPVLERRWAEKCGLGQIGRNHQLIHPTLGSFVHPGELVLNEPCLMERKHHPFNLICEQCQICRTQCPRQALSGEWNAKQCIAYETHKCTICQQNCPYNEIIL